MNQHTIEELSSKVNKIKLEHTNEIVRLLFDRDYIHFKNNLHPYRLNKEEMNYIMDEKEN